MSKAKNPFAHEIRKVKAFLRRNGARWALAHIVDMAFEMHKLDGTTCWTCGRTIEDIALDHKIPSSRGGDTSPQNISPKHDFCNRAKSNLTEWEWNVLIDALHRMEPVARLSVLRRLAIGWRAAVARSPKQEGIDGQRRGKERRVGNSGSQKQARTKSAASSSGSDARTDEAVEEMAGRTTQVVGRRNGGRKCRG